MSLKKLMHGTLLSVLLVLTGCSKDTPPGDYDAAEVGKVKRVIPGVIISMRPVRLHNRNAEAGVIRSETGKQGDLYSGSGITGSRGFEYVIKLNSGSIISLVQSEDTKLKVKQHILVIHGRHTRIVADNGSDDF